MKLIRNMLATFGGFALLLLATPIVPWAVQKTEAPWGREDGPVLVVPGGDMLIAGNGPEATLGYDTYLRCVMASVLARRVSYRYIVVTGSWGLAKAMEQFLVSHGIDQNRILQENAAQSTYENATFTKRILNAVYGGNLPHIVVLTSDFHSRRALLTFRHAGFDASCVPAPDLIKRCSTNSFRLEAAKILVIEWVTLASYELKGFA